MSRKKTKTPGELLQHSLAGRPAGSRCVLVLDPDRIGDIGRTLTDTKGRSWEVVFYRGDDIVTRRAWQKTWEQGNPVALVLSRAEGDESVLDASSIADMVSRAEGEIVDLSLLGYFHSLFPKVNPPPGALRQHRQAFLESVEGIVKAYPDFKARWGEPDSWSRGHFLAILLLARFPEWTIDDLWCNESEPAPFAAHAIGLLCHRAVTATDLSAVSEVIWESSRYNRNAEQWRWLAAAPEDLEQFRSEIGGFLVIHELLAGRNIAHLDTILKENLSISTFEPKEVSESVPAILGALNETGQWSHIQARSQDFLTARKLARIDDLLHADPKTLSRLVTSANTATPVVEFLLRQAIMAHFQKGTPWPGWLEELAKHPLIVQKDGERLQDQDRACAALMSGAVSIRWIEETITAAIPSFAGPEELLDWYTGNQRHLLEFRTADAFAKLEMVDDPALHAAGYTFIMRSPDGLRYRVRRYLNEIDKKLAAFVAADPQKFLTGKRSALRIIPEVVRGGGRATNRRVWLLVMDGMRYDTWDAVLRPLLMEHFEVVGGQDRPYFSLLPSKTDIARRGLLAGCLGRDWKDHFGRSTKDERKLAARAMGVNKQDLDSKVLFVTEAETAQARAKMGYNPGEARQLNVFIYPISDDLGHYHNDTLAALNDKIRQQLLTQHGIRGIVDDLRRRVQPGDLVLITSDHGFQELLPEECVKLSTGSLAQRGRTDDDVVYRYLRFAPSKDLSLGDHVVVPWEELASDGRKQQTTFTLAVGGTWYQREKGKPTRFAHGGLSLAEMTIPAVLLQPIVEKAARIDFLDLPAQVAIGEDEQYQLEFELVNQGNVESAYELTAETNLGETVIQKSGVLASGKREPLSCMVTGRYQSGLDRAPVADKTLTVILLRLGHTDLTGKIVRPNYGRQTVQVTVKPKLTKIETDALKAFDDL